ncbi:hypothetical protein FB45DRAFT_444275 [Roridomyces roridus]|uniref:Uncharacterized protein n=1 Tax=Roridomyces roridus TaxID=1738132 RepID=A0AAD7C0R0_9AGAR|nr:hypothetical protein FB45DRAFT_444275 [Roridomyces roridus]
MPAPTQPSSAWLSPPTMTLSLTSTSLLSLALGSLIYGVYILLFCITLFLLVRRHGAMRNSRFKRRLFKSVIFWSSIGLFLVITMHWITTFYRAFSALILIEDRAEAEMYLGDPAQATMIIQDVALSLSMLIGDSLIIYRLWVVWAPYNGLVVVVPIISVAALTVGSSVSTYVVSRSMTVFDDWHWLKVNASLTLVTNVYCTVFISWRIWSVTRHCQAVGRSPLTHFVVVVVESAGLYALWAVLFVAAFASKSNLQFIIIQTAPEVIGFVNALILVRVGMGWSSEQTECETRQLGSEPLVFAGSGSGSRPGSGVSDG